MLQYGAPNSPLQFVVVVAVVVVVVIVFVSYVYDILKTPCKSSQELNAMALFTRKKTMGRTVLFSGNILS